MSAVYRRDALTWVAFVALFAFGFLNSALGPALPYIRAEEDISYIGGALHQAAFAVGGGLAGLLAARRTRSWGQTRVICGGLAGAALAGLGLGYGHDLALTIGAAFAMSLLGTSALIRVWAVLADRHGPRRTQAMTEGEVTVSVSGIGTALLVGGLAATTLTWRFTFVVGGSTVVLAAVAVAVAGVPAAAPGLTGEEPRSAAPTSAPTSVRRLPPTLVLALAIVALEFSLSFWLASYLDESVGLGRDLAAAMVSGLYAANLLGRVLASRLAGRMTAERLLVGSLLVCLAGLPVLLLATDAVVAAVGLTLAGAAIGAMFPLTSSLHVGASSRTADGAMGQVLAVAALGQILGPMCVGVIAQVAGLRAGLLILPALVVLAGVALARHHDTRGRPRPRSPSPIRRP